MKLNRKSLTAAFVSCLLVTACGTVPPREVHTAAGTMRTTMIDTTPKGSSPQLFSVGGSLSRGPGTMDTGRPQGATNLSADLEIRPLSSLAFGFQPYYSFQDGDIDNESHLGAQLYARWRFAEISKWAFSAYSTFGYGKNKAVERGSTCYFFACVSTADTSEARVETIEGGLGIISSYYINERDLVSLTPMIFLTRTSGMYSVNNVTISTAAKTGLNYSLMASYGHIFEIGDNDSMLQFSGGAATQRGFSTFESKRRVIPIVHIGYQISLGSR